MKNWVRILFTVCCIIGGALAIAKAYAGETLYHGTLTRIVDGDTVHFRVADASPDVKDLKIRMVSIDAPESHFPLEDGTMVGQGKYGQAATQYLESLVSVGSETELESLGIDKYHRTLGRVLYKGRDVNLQMVRAGWAVPYIICDNARCDAGFFEREHVAEYFQACDEARSNGRGIFSPRHTLREMPYEFRLRMSRRTPDKFVGDFDSRKLHQPDEIRAVDVCRRVFFMSRQAAENVGYQL